MTESKAMVALQGREARKYRLHIILFRILPPHLSCHHSWQPTARGFHKLGMTERTGKQRAEGLGGPRGCFLTAEAPEQPASDGQSPVRVEKDFLLPSLLYFLDLPLLALLIRINCHYRESHESDVLLR